MKKNLLLTILSIVTFVSVTNAQNDKQWEVSSNSDVSEVNKAARRDNFPSDFKLFQLKGDVLQTKLKKLTASGSQESTTTIEIPNAQGEIERFVVYESSNFTPELQAQFPGIRSFVGVGLDDNKAQVRLSSDPNGIQAMVFRTDKRNEFVEAYSSQNKVYAVFNSDRKKGELPWTCSTDDKNMLSGAVLDKNISNRASNTVYKTMRLAISCTAEYSNYFGATSPAQSALVIAAYNATMTRVNGIFERDLALKLLLVAQTTNVIYYNPATDPYSAVVGGNTPNSWNVELQNTLSSSLTGPSTTLLANNAAYDIGHLFGASGGGGNAGCIGCVCSDDTASNSDKNKGSGFTSPSNNVPSGDTFDVDFVAHEMGHQLGGNHTFSHTFENNAVNVEPGSGSTIMAYAGITGATDVQSNSDDYFTYRSILQIQTNLASKSCPVSVPVTHGTPVVNAGPNKFAPKGTPFFLTPVSATDSGGGSLTYCWEQNDDQTVMIVPANQNAPTAQEDTDAAALSFPSASKINGANFRSFKPVSTSTRFFPSLASLTSAVPSIWEVLSDVSRQLNFALTVRDNVANGGQTGTATTRVTVNENVGPFTVTSQNAAALVFPIGSTQTVTWDVNSTNATTAGSPNVDILFSNDGGLTYPNVLLTATPNDGSQAVTLPAGVSGARCRFMVRANTNIFFNISQKAFAVGDYTYQTVNACTDYPFVFNSPITETAPPSITGFNLPINDTFTISDVNVRVSLTHPNISNLTIAIREPGGALKALHNGGCPNVADINLNYDSQGTAVNCANTTSLAATLPLTTLNTINGTQSNGAWGFFIRDSVVGDGITGTLGTVVFNLCKSELTPVLTTQEFKFEDFSLYPNPNKGDFTVKFKSNSTNDIKINVYDMRGRSILEKSFTNTTNFNQNISLDQVQAGIYLVSILDGPNKIVKRIVVE